MDDPGLAQRLEHTALDQERGTERHPLTYRVDAERRSPSSASAEELAGAAYLSRGTDRRSGLAAVAATVFAAAAGSAAGWFFGDAWGSEPRIWAIGGGATGLLVLWLGWMGMRWNSTRP